ncbi:MAG: hypothetical protein P8J32_03220 [bacterium]|jgi:hypothetical protein|nr:hypothetical protein [bacterium]
MNDLNQTPAPTPVQEEVHKNKTAMIGVVVLIAAAAFLAGVVVAKSWSMTTQEPVVIIEEEEVQEDVEVIEEEEEVEELTRVSTDEELWPNWIDPLEQPVVPTNEVLLNSFCPIEYDSEGNLSEYQPCGDREYVSQYQLGTITGGEYDGRSLEMFAARMGGMGFFQITLYLLVDPEGTSEVVVLDQMASSISEGFPSSNTTNATDLMHWTNADSVNEVYEGMILDETATIPSLVPADAIQDLNGNLHLYTGSWLHYTSERAVSPLEATTEIQAQGGRTLKMYEAPEEPSTVVGKQQSFILGLDGRILWHDLEVPFFEYGSNDATDRIITQGVPLVTWNDGSQNEETYFKGAVGGCGFTNATNVIDGEAIAALGLEVAGSAEGYDIYEPTSYEIEYYENRFNMISFETSEEDEEELTYADFPHSYIYFEDALGRWIELQLDALIPPVECGKPVIYLYPEEEMELSVWVEPKGGFSYTEPVYDGGWEVFAAPSGKLVNLKDGKQYHYLFWEGRGDLYPQVETYWVIEQKDVEGFLVTKLREMNLNKIEIIDFLAFWLPRMEDDAYYKIGFHGTQIMDELAPLSLSVDPDHVFRILMDYQGLDAWEESNPPVRLPQANRTGFEVIEWGGVLR